MFIVTVIGMGCSRCRELEERVRLASKSMSVPIEIALEDNLDVMLDFQVRSTPCLLVDDKIYFDDHLPTQNEVESLLKALSSASNSKSA
jgi:hypothetical protein